MSKEPKVLLLYPPNQSWPGYMCKPNGSLAYPSLAGALLEEGIEVRVFDACVGGDRDDLQEVFYRSTELPTGLLRTGVPEQRILDEVEGTDVIGLTSIFTEQESMVLATARLIKRAFPDKLIVSGGVNARSRIDVFLANGIDAVCLSEAERTIVEIVRETRRGSRDLSRISSLAFRIEGRTCVNKTRPEDVVWDLDKHPLPAWHLLPYERYWRIGRPHGGHFGPGAELRYGSIMTSRGCVFSCAFCHIAAEGEDSPPGEIGRFRIKSDERVFAEVQSLKNLGVRQVFLEDDSFFGRKKRAIRLLRSLKGAGIDIFPMNGVNLIHLFDGPEPDIEVLEALREAGCRELVLPFETGSSRIMKEYISNKFDGAKHNVEGLIRACKELGFVTSGNYMIGWPDETLEEIQMTIDLAKRHRSYGLDSVYPLIVIPLPGTPLFDKVLKQGQLPADWCPDRINWTKANLVQTAVPAQELEEIRRSIWMDLNDPDYLAYKLKMNVPESSGP